MNTKKKRVQLQQFDTVVIDTKTVKYEKARVTTQNTMLSAIMINDNNRRRHKIPKLEEIMLCAGL